MADRTERPSQELIQTLLLRVFDSVKLGDQKQVIKMAYILLDETNFRGFLYAVTEQ